MKIEIFSEEIFNRAGEVLFLWHFEDAKKFDPWLKKVDDVLEGAVTEALSSKRFQGKSGQGLILPTYRRLKAKYVVVLGLGKRKEFKLDTARKTGGKLVHISRELRVWHALALIPDDALELREAAQAFCEGVLLGNYRFHSYKGAQQKNEDKPRELKTLGLYCPERKKSRQIEEGLKKAETHSGATLLARDLVNTPSADMTPRRLAEAAKALCVPGSGLSCKVIEKADMEKMGMRAALAVAHGSEHEPVGIHLRYTPRGAVKTIAVVGKAVTFDSGGLSLKPSEHMTTMKIDMAGAASVIGLFSALKEIKPRVNVHGIFLAAENMPSGAAYRPGDIVEAMDGTTIEIVNTDAEGRVTLADSLSFAAKQKPDIILDFATLTGACVAALGEDIAGLFTDDENLAKRIIQSAEEAGEQLWRLPLFGGYAQQIKSKIADIKNTGGGHGGGAITAALFLKIFVGDIPWAHIDIAGPSYTERETRPDLPYGASGYGVRLLLNFLDKMGKGR